MGGWEGTMANSSIGFGSPGLCLEVCFPSVSRKLIKNCSYVVSRKVLLSDLRRVMVLFVGAWV